MAGIRALNLLVSFESWSGSGRKADAFRVFARPESAGADFGHAPDGLCYDDGPRRGDCTLAPPFIEAVSGVRLKSDTDSVS